MNKILEPVLQKYSLKLTEVLRVADGGTIRSHVVIATNSDGDKYAVKFFDSPDTEAKERFLEEISTVYKLRKDLSSKYRSWVPAIKWHNKKGGHPYVIYKYFEGQLLGSFVEDFGIKWGRFDDRNFASFIEFFTKLHELDSNLYDSVLGSWGERTARKEIQFYFENVDELLPAVLYDQVRSFIDRYGKEAFKYRVCSHRDLYPENILIKDLKSKHFNFLDWEYFSMVPIGFDAAFLYLIFWREEYWKAKIFSYFYNYYELQNNSRKLRAFILSFRFSLVVLAIRFLYQLETYGDKNREGYHDARLSYIFDLENAIRGSIVKPRNVKFYIGMNDIKKVAERYGICDVTKYEIFYASKGNTVARVDTPHGTYVFRFYSQSRSATLIRRELGIFKKLNECEIKTYKVISPLEGDLYSRVKLYGTSRRVAVLTFVPGKKIQRRWSNKRSARETGSTLRKIHDCNVIHGDYSKENVLFIKSRVSGVIDFEWGRNTKSRKAKKNDLAKGIALWLIDIRSKNIDDIDFIREFIKGYYDKMPEGDDLNDLIGLIIDKIEGERDIFLTTIDKRVDEDSKVGLRFDSAIQKVRQLNEHYKMC